MPKDDREAAQKRFDDACRDAGMSNSQKQQFSREMHNSRQLQDGMTYREIKALADEWMEENKNKYR